jgi:hypothetical protein
MIRPGRVLFFTAMLVYVITYAGAARANSTVGSQTLTATNAGAVPNDQLAQTATRGSATTGYGGVYSDYPRAYNWRSVAASDVIMSAVPWSIVSASQMDTSGAGGATTGGQTQYQFPAAGVWSGVPTVPVCYIAEVHSSHFIAITGLSHIFWSPSSATAFVPASVFTTSPVAGIANGALDSGYWNTGAENLNTTGYTLLDGRGARPTLGGVDVYFVNNATTQIHSQVLIQAAVEDTANAGRWKVRELIVWRYAGVSTIYNGQAVRGSWYRERSNVTTASFSGPSAWSGSIGYRDEVGVVSLAGALHLGAVAASSAQINAARQEYGGAVWAGSNVSFNTTARDEYERLGDPTYRDALLTNGLVTPPSSIVDSGTTGGPGGDGGLFGGWLDYITNLLQPVTTALGGLSSNMFWWMDAMSSVPESGTVAP